MVSRGGKRTHTLIEKSRARSSRCCGLAFVVTLKFGVGMFGDISYDKAILNSSLFAMQQSEGKLRQIYA